MALHLKHKLLPVLLYAPLVAAQGQIISSTAAWSSQIIAFWGAVGLGARISRPGKVTNSITALTSLRRIWRRYQSTTKGLAKGSWIYLSPGLTGGNVRMHIVVICWSNEADIGAFALRVAMIVEAAGRQNWAVLVVGRRLRNPDIPSYSFWTMCPRISGFSTVREKASGGPRDRLSTASVDHIAQSLSRIPWELDDFINALAKQPRPATRVALFNEVSAEVQTATTLARHITSWNNTNTSPPYVRVLHNPSQFGMSRALAAKTAVYMYLIVHVMVSVAVGLMAAATGRGLATWLFSVRITIGQLSGDAFVGDETLMTLLGFDNLVMLADTHENDILDAGDVRLARLHHRYILLIILINVVEFGIVFGGWAYGALNAQRLRPTGLVGHGMLWLAIVVDISLALRALQGISERLSGRVIGIAAQGTHYIVPHDVTVQEEEKMPPMLLMLFDIMNRGTDDEASVAAGLELLRRPHFSSEVERVIAVNILAFSYEDDRLARRGRESVSTRTFYPWKTFFVCVVIAIVSAIFSAIYAYDSRVPFYTKMIVEVLISGCTIIVATMERESGLAHMQTSYLSMMVSCMVICAVWYVGVEGVG